MFAVFGAVLGALDFYEKGTFKGIKIAFKGGVYSDPQLGPNWWTYFFEPICIGDENFRSYTFSLQDHRALAHIGFHMPRQRAYELIQRYIKPLPHIQEKVDAYYDDHFLGHFVIGIHHRGTDKVIEMPRVAFEKTLSALTGVINSLNEAQNNSLKIYIATDDSNFIDYMLKLYPNQVIYNDFVRSDDDRPLHYGSDEKYRSIYQKGEEPLIDCLLLSRCNHMIRPWSSLSTIADHFNPSMPITTLWGD